MLNQPTTWRFPLHVSALALTRTSPILGDHFQEGSDEILFARTCQTGDHASFGILVGRYRARVAGLARRMLTGYSALNAEVEDIAQEAFVEAFHKRGTFKTGQVFRPWLYRIVVNRCIDRQRKSQRLQQSALLDSDLTAHSSPETIILRRERHHLIDLAVAQLPPKHRAVLVLRYIDDLSYEEIAAATELPLGTVKTYLFRARAEMKQRLEADDHD